MINNIELETCIKKVFGEALCTEILASSRNEARELHLSGQSLDTEQIKIISEMLKINTSLQTLSLYNIKLADEEVGLLAEALKVNTSLQILNLSFSGLTTSGFKLLAEVLKTNVSLQTLNISHNELTEVGAALLAEALKVNTSLLFITGDRLVLENENAKDLIKLIVSYLERNTSYYKKDVKIKIKQSEITEKLSKKKALTQEDLNEINASLQEAEAIYEKLQNKGYSRAPIILGEINTVLASIYQQTGQPTKFLKLYIDYFIDHPSSYVTLQLVDFLMQQEILVPGSQENFVKWKLIIAILENNKEPQAIQWVKRCHEELKSNVNIELKLTEQTDLKEIQKNLLFFLLENLLIKDFKLDAKEAFKNTPNQEIEKFLFENPLSFTSLKLLFENYSEENLRIIDKCKQRQGDEALKLTQQSSEEKLQISSASPNVLLKPKSEIQFLYSNLRKELADSVSPIVEDKQVLRRRNSIS